MLRNEKGFTLIEIIAVLIIFAILATVAIPRYFGLQEQAADKVADAALSSAYSAISFGYAANKLNATGAPSGPEAACSNVQISGDTITSVTCTGAAWGTSGAAVPISIVYTGGTSGRSPLNATWNTP